MGPTRVAVDVVRNGRRVQSLAVDYIVEGEVAARATATRVRVDETLASETIGVGLRPEDLPPKQPSEVPEMTGVFAGFDFVRNFTVRREDLGAGRAMSWTRLDRPFVEGESNTALISLAAVADMIPNANSILCHSQYLSINPDLSIAVSRLPEGDWIGSSAVVRTARRGVGQTDAALFDTQGVVGRSIKSLLIDSR